jgi:SAM-dependent methyltransferase
MTEHAPEIFDRALYLARQSRARGTEILQNHVAAELGERLSFIIRSFPNSLLITQSPENIAQALQLSGKIAQLEIAAPSNDDDLKLPENKFDAVFSLLDLHCVNDVPGHLAQLGRSLKPDGLLVVAFFAGDTLSELRESWLNAELEITGGVSPRVGPMIGVRELGGLMQRAGLALPVADTDHTTVRYSDVFALMREIKSFGYSNPLTGRSARFISKRFLTKMAEHYHANSSDDDGRIRATLEITWAMAWKPHESQPKPLKPGSATHRLEEALKNNKVEQ